MLCCAAGPCWCAQCKARYLCTPLMPALDPPHPCPALPIALPRLLPCLAYCPASPIALPCLLPCLAYFPALPIAPPCLLPCPAYCPALPISPPCLLPCPAYFPALPIALPCLLPCLLPHPRWAAAYPPPALPLITIHPPSPQRTLLPHLSSHIAQVRPARPRPAQPALPLLTRIRQCCLYCCDKVLRPHTPGPARGRREQRRWRRRR